MVTALSIASGETLVPLLQLKESERRSAFLVRNKANSRLHVARRLDVADLPDADTRLKRLEQMLPGLTGMGLQPGLRLERSESDVWLIGDWISGYPANETGRRTLHHTWITWFAAQLIRALIPLHRVDPPFHPVAFDPSDIILGLTSATLVDLGVLEHVFPEVARSVPAPYVAPEVRAGATPDARSDVYSLGACFFWMLTGEAPDVKGAEDQARMADLLKEARPTMEDGWRDAFLHLIACDPSGRPQTARDAAQTLKPWVPATRPMTSPLPSSLPAITNRFPAPWIEAWHAEPKATYGGASEELKEAVFALTRNLPALVEEKQAVGATLEDAAPASSGLQIQASHRAADFDIPKPPRPGRPPRGKVPLERLRLFYTRAAAMQEASVPLHRIMELLASQEDSLVLAFSVGQIGEKLWDGQSLSKAMGAFPAIFRPFHVALVRQAEETGRMSDALSDLAALCEREMQLRRKVQGALFYPGLVLLVSACMTFGLFRWVLPGLLSGLDRNQPFITRILMGGVFVVNQPVLLTTLVVAFAAGLYLLAGWLKTPRGGASLEKAALHVPLAGRLVSQLGQVRGFRVLCAQLRCGIGIIPALRTASDACGSVTWSTLFKTTADNIVSGATFSEALRLLQAPHTRIVIQMAQGGEESGDLDGMLERATNILEEDINCAVDSLVQLLEPMMVVGVGLVTGFVLLGSILPIYGLLATL